MAMSTKDMLLKKLNEILPEVNLKKETTNSVLRKLSDLTGEDVSPYKQPIKEAITEYLQQQPDEDEDEDEADTAAPAVKKAKVEGGKGSKPTKRTKPQKHDDDDDDDADGAEDESADKAIDMGGKKRATVSEFKGRRYVDLREWYEKDGELMPGKKGISLAPDLWKKLCENHKAITAALQKSDDSFSLQLGGLKKVTISKFSGKYYVDVREYYEKDGAQLPGRKGLSMKPEQWEILLGCVKVMNRQL